MVNKILHCFDLLPFWGEAIGLIILVLAALVWAITINNVARGKFSKSVLTLSACALITLPYIGKSAIWRGCLAQAGIVLLFAGVAAYFYHRYLETKAIKYLIYAPLCSMVALCFDKAYITTVIMGAGFVLMMHILQEKYTWKRFFSEAIKLFGWVICSVFVTVVFVKLLQFVLGVTPNNYTSTYFR